MYDPLMIDAWNINVLMGRFLQFQVAMSTQDVLVAKRYPIAHTAASQISGYVLLQRDCVGGIRPVVTSTSSSGVGVGYDDTTLSWRCSGNF